jgi:hypothetical protein
MANLMATLGKQVGPLPLGAWLAVVGGGLGIAWYAQRSQGGAADTGDDETQLAEAGVGEGTAAFIPAAEVSQPAPTVETLDEWINKAVRAAVSIGASPLQIEQALRLYAKGEKLSSTQEQIVNRVITLIGPAPAGEITDAPQLPAPTPTPITPKYHITVLYAPSGYKQGRAAVFQGRLINQATGLPIKNQAVRVQRKHLSADSWKFYKFARTGADGRFSVSASEVRRGDRQFYIRFGYSNVYSPGYVVKQT